MDKNKRKALLEAIANNDLEKLRKAVGKSLPDKWFCFVFDHSAQTIKHGNKLITKEEAQAMLTEARKEYNVRITAMHFNRNEDQTSEEEWDIDIEPEMALVWRKVSLKIE